MAKAPSLTPKEGKFVKAYVASNNKRRAAQVATGASPEVAAVQANRMLKNVNVQEAIQAEMSKQGITLELIVKPIRDGLEAEKVSIVGNGEQAMAEVTPDHSIRLKASSMAQQLIGLNKGSEGVSVHFHQHQADQKAKYDL